MRRNISLTKKDGLLVQLNNHDLLLEISRRGDGYGIEKIYTGTGVELEEGDYFASKKVDSTFYDQLYQEVDEKQYFEV